MTASADRTRPRRLVVMAPNWLGDAVMMSPLLSLLADARYPGDGRPLGTVLAIRRRWAPLYQGDPRIGDILPIERQGRHGGWRGISALAGDLRSVRADGIILGPPSLRSALAGRLAGIPLRIGYRTDGRGALLNLSLPFPGKGRGHYSAQLCRLGEAFVERQAGTLAGPPVESLTLLPALAGLAPWPVGDGPQVWAVGPGATYGEAKSWPALRVGEFLDLAVRGFGVRVVLLGDASGIAFAEAVRQASSAPWRSALVGGPGVVDLLGRTGLTEAARILAACSAFVGNDSGLMHLAGALGVPTVGIFGSSDPDWTAPLGPRTAVVTAEGFACRPCFRPSCNQPRFCLDSVGAPQVMAVVQRLLGAKPDPGGRS